MLYSDETRDQKLLTLFEMEHNGNILMESCKKIQVRYHIFDKILVWENSVKFIEQNVYHMCVHVHACAYVNACMHARAHVQIPLYSFNRHKLISFVCKCIHAYVHMCVHTRMFRYLYIETQKTNSLVLYARICACACARMFRYLSIETLLIKTQSLVL